VVRVRKIAMSMDKEVAANPSQTSGPRDAEAALYSDCDSPRRIMNARNRGLPQAGTGIDAEVGKDLVRYHQEIYIVVLGLGFGFFAQNFVGDLFEPGTSTLWKYIMSQLMGLIFFISLYYFFAYDWIAYNILLRRFPYTITGNLLSMGRCYADLVALLVKASLISIAAQKVTFIISFLQRYCSPCGTLRS
jgi:hypothetical protein